MKWKEKGQFLFSVGTDTSPSVKCFTIVEFFKGLESGGIYYQYAHSDWTYCPLNNYPIEQCKEIESCSKCPQASHFLVLDDGEVIPVRKLPLYGDI